MYNEGISYLSDLINTGLKYGAIAKSGNTLSFGEEKLGVGFDAAKKVLKEKGSQVWKKIESEIWKKAKEEKSISQ